MLEVSRTLTHRTEFNISMSKSTKGRGTASNTPNKFEAIHREPLEQIEISPEADDDRPVRTVFYKDNSKTILSKNNSPDVPFAYSINPYRGCEHGCIYCYARPSHEYLGFSAGLDFESKILVKHDAPELLEAAFKKKSWQPQWICFSGNTDCYQPIEQKLKLTQRCLEVFLKYRNPVGIITKNSLVLRDLDILKAMHEFNLIEVTISITSFDTELIRVMEPRTATPAKRLEVVEILSSHGIPVSVNVAPIIPGLNDEEIPAIIKESAARGAYGASYTIVRLPGAVEQIFKEWVRKELPDRADKIIHRIEEIHGGSANDSRWKLRMTGEGSWSETIKKLFLLQCEKYGLNTLPVDLSTEHFRRETKRQIEMF